MSTQNKKKQIFKALNKKLFFSTLLLIAGFFFVQIYITSLVGTKSTEIENIRFQKDNIRLENEILQSQIDQQYSMENIKKVAEKYKLTEKYVEEVDAKQGPNVALSIGN